MKLYTISQGSKVENLKHFMYITNEYGKPSEEFIDSFLENFGGIVLNGNFRINDGYTFKVLDDLWEVIKKDCENNKTTCTYNYGGLFYYILGNKAVDILKSEVGKDEWKNKTYDNKLIYLRTFIEHFDESITDEYKSAFDEIMKASKTVVAEKEKEKAETEQSEELETPEKEIKHYKLKEEYSASKGDNSLIDCKIEFNSNDTAIIISDTTISVNNETVDIGEYIDRNNIDINSITIGAYWFNEVYE